MKNNNKKILFLLHLPPPVHGVSMMGEVIKKSKLINNTFETRYINLLVSRSIDETGKTKVLKVWRFIVSWFNLLIELIKEKPTLCYFALSNSGSAFYKDVLLITLLKVFKVKIVFHIHSKGIKKNESNKINYLLYKYVFKNNAVILLSYLLYHDIKTFVSEDNVYICANGLPDILKKKQNIRDVEQKKSNEIVKILFLSNLMESKGLFILLDACKIIQNKNLPFYCIIVGGEGDVSALKLQQKIQELNLENNVKYVGKKYDKEKVSIFLKTDIFAFPTYNETFGLVNLEAMQYSIPVVSTFEGGIPDIIDDGISGFLVPQKNVQALSEKLVLLIKNPELRYRMGKAGREKYEKKFTLQVFETKLQEILEELLLKKTVKQK